MGPTVLLRGEATEEATQIAGAIVAAYSDGDTADVTVHCRFPGAEREIRVARNGRSMLQPYMI